jgi:hypothetical protein
MTAIGRALDAIFRNRHMASDGVYLPQGGDPVPVRVMLRRGDAAARGVGIDAFVPAAAAEVRVSELAEVVEGARLTIGPEAWIVMGPRREDPDRLVWTMGLETAP